MAIAPKLTTIWPRSPLETTQITGTKAIGSLSGVRLADEMVMQSPLQVVHVRLVDDLHWNGVGPGMAGDAVRADLLLRMGCAEIRFPGVHVGHDFRPECRVGLKSILTGVLEEIESPSGVEGTWTHLMTMGPGHWLEAFIHDAFHLYLAFHSNEGGTLQIEARIPWRSLVEAETQMMDQMKVLLDARGSTPSDQAARGRYLGTWERLRTQALTLDGRLPVSATVEDPLADA